MSNQAQPTPQPTKSGSSKTSKASSETATIEPVETESNGFARIEDLEAAVTQVLLANQQKTMFLEVTSDLMKQLLRGQTDQAATYKGVRLFVEGKMTKILEAEKVRI